MPEPQPQGHPISFSDYLILNKIHCAVETLRSVAHKHIETLHPTDSGGHIFIKLK